MKALVYEGPNQKSLQNIAEPTIESPFDAIIKMSTSTICGTDLHILKGDVPTCIPGTVLGHEGIGTITEIGDSVRQFNVGDRVLISCISADGTCEQCRKGMFSHCINGGWVLGHKINGTQAEYVRTPFADTSLYKLPSEGDLSAYVMLSDILPTGYECGVLNGSVQPGNVIAIVGAGPIGLAAILTAKLYSPSQIIVIDTDDYRLAQAQRMGATDIINSKKQDPIEFVEQLTASKGVDVAIEAVGVPETFELCEQIVTAGGNIANIGVHGKKVNLFLEKLWSHNIKITTRLVDTISTPLLLKFVTTGKLDVQQFISHRFHLTQVDEAYNVFSNAIKNKALKVLIDM